MLGEVLDGIGWVGGVVVVAGWDFDEGGSLLHRSLDCSDDHQVQLLLGDKVAGFEPSTRAHVSGDVDVSIPDNLGIPPLYFAVLTQYVDWINTDQ